MWSLGSKIDARPPCRCFVALPGIFNPQIPQFVTVIDLAQWPHWYLWGYVLVGIDPEQEPALIAWQTTHPDD